MKKNLERMIGAPLTPAEYDRALREVLRSYRKQGGLTKADLATAAGVSVQQIKRYEEGTNKVSVSQLMQLSHALGVPASRLIAEIEVIPDTSSVSNGLDHLSSTEDGRKLLFVLQRTMDPSQVSLISQLVLLLAQHRNTSENA
ncbi:MAG: helix-turn-helix transcriptional regulator [Pseudomonadota bacterium]